jgi:hypothetical protein
MKRVVTIAPVLHEPGLIAYECPGCGYVTSILHRSEEEGDASSQSDG